MGGEKLSEDVVTSVKPQSDEKLTFADEAGKEPEAGKETVTKQED